MNKGIVLSGLLFLAALHCAAAPDNIIMGFKMEDGVYPQIKQAVERAFPGNKIYPPAAEDTVKQLTVEDVSPAQEQAFVAMLRQLGHNVISLEDNFYEIRLMEGADRIWTIEVNSSAFRSDIPRLMELQKILGKSIVGGAGDPLNIKKGDAPAMCWALLNGNFAYRLQEVNGVKQLIVTERQIPVTIILTNSLQRECLEAIGEVIGARLGSAGDRVIFTVRGPQLGKVREKLRALLGGFSENSVDFTWVFIPAQPQKHNVRVLLSKGDDFAKQKAEVIAAMNSKNAKADFIVESVEEDSVGSKSRLRFAVTSYRNTDAITNAVVSLLNPCRVKRNRIAVD